MVVVLWLDSLCQFPISNMIQWNPSNPDTLGPKAPPDYQGILITGVGDVLWLIVVEYLVPLVCVHIRGVSPIQGLGLD